jgi:hypothetical protein
MTVKDILRRPSAFLPVAMSVAALTLVVWFLARFGVVHEEDESAYARIFQLLLAAQVPIVAYFALTWLPRAPRQAAIVLAIQLSAAIAALTPVFLLEL